MTSPSQSGVIGSNGHKEEAAVVERLRRRARARRIRAARELDSRLELGPGGNRRFLRFNRSQRFEHQLLIITFTALAITGLLQRYSSSLAAGWIINSIFGGIDTLRTLHHFGAVAFILEGVYHVAQLLMVWFVKREIGGMWPRWKDFTDLIDMIGFNLGLAHKRPEHDRYSVEEKIEYWALLWGSLIMILTGLIQWFPTQITLVLPGDSVPVSRSIHGWEAVLATLSILIWHLYHTVIKERNKSIFTGYMSEAEMRESHPLEYRRILAAHAFLQTLEMPKEARQEPAAALDERAQSDLTTTSRGKDE
jgi:formate dehydrogenase gamma subunit